MKKTIKVLQVIPKIGDMVVLKLPVMIWHIISPEKDCKSYIVTSGGELIKYIKKDKVEVYSDYLSTPRILLLILY